MPPTRSPRASRGAGDGGGDVGDENLKVSVRAGSGGGGYGRGRGVGRGGGRGGSGPPKSKPSRRAHSSGGHPNPDQQRSGGSTALGDGSKAQRAKRAQRISQPPAAPKFTTSESQWHIEDGDEVGLDEVIAKANRTGGSSHWVTIHEVRRFVSCVG